MPNNPPPPPADRSKIPEKILVVDPDGGGERLDRYLSRNLADAPSRTVLQRWIASGRVLVNGNMARSSRPLSPGDRILVFERTAPPVPPKLMAQDPPPAEWMLFVDEDLLVVNKPAGLPVHPSRGHWDHSLVHRLLPLLTADEVGETQDDRFRPGIVHRLDKDTTGCLVVARTPAVRLALSNALARREVHRRYLAVIGGRLDPPEGTIDAPVGRDPKNRLRMATVVGGRPARTRYRTLMAWEGMSLVECKLETGRTHQIRVHMAALGHPVAGDALYRGAAVAGLEHQALHAWRLAFIHPVTHIPRCFVAPLPGQWAALKNLLGDPQAVWPKTSSMDEEHDAFACPSLDPFDLWERLGGLPRE